MSLKSLYNRHLNDNDPSVTKTGKPNVCGENRTFV
jgi:hypothetical protein